MTMPVIYFAPKVTEVTVKLCIIDFFLFEITVVKIMNNLYVRSAHSYVYPRSRLKHMLVYIKRVKTVPHCVIGSLRKQPYRPPPPRKQKFSYLY